MHTDVRQSGDVLLICDLLRRWNDGGQLPAAQLARIWHMAPHSVYPYYTDREPRWSQVAQLYDGVDADLKLELIKTITAGSGVVSSYIDVDLDVNGDGRVDADDALAAAIDKAELWGRVIKQIYEQAQQDVDMDIERAAAGVRTVTEEIIQGAVLVERIVTFAIEQRKRRKIRRPAGRGA